MSWLTSLAEQYPVLVYGAIVVGATAFFTCLAFSAFKSEGTSKKDRLALQIVVTLALCAVLTFTDTLWNAGIAVAGGTFLGVVLGILASCFIKRERETVLRQTPTPPSFDH